MTRPRRNDEHKRLGDRQAGCRTRAARTSLRTTGCIRTHAHIHRIFCDLHKTNERDKPLSSDLAPPDRTTIRTQNVRISRTVSLPLPESKSPLAEQQPQQDQRLSTVTIMATVTDCVGNRHHIKRHFLSFNAHCQGNTTTRHHCRMPLQQSLNKTECQVFTAASASRREQHRRTPLHLSPTRPSSAASVLPD